MLKIDITELGMVVRLVEMMYLRLEFLDPAPIIRARQLEAARGRRGGAIDQKEIEQRAHTKANKNEHGPDPFLTPHRVHKHPQVERGHQENRRIGKNNLPIGQIGNQRRKIDSCWVGTGRHAQKLFSAARLANKLFPGVGFPPVFLI